MGIALYIGMKTKHTYDKRHPVDLPIEKWICPHTGKPFKNSWSFSGSSFAYCEQCNPGEFKPVSQRLKELSDKIEKEKAKKQLT